MVNRQQLAAPVRVCIGGEAHLQLEAVLPDAGPIWHRLTLMNAAPLVLYTVVVAAKQRVNSSAASVPIACKHVSAKAIR